MKRASVGALATAFVWAVAEAVRWPLMPEAVLVPLAAATPAAWWQLAPASVPGSSLGGYAAADTWPSSNSG